VLTTSNIRLKNNKQTAIRPWNACMHVRDGNQSRVTQPIGVSDVIGGTEIAEHGNLRSISIMP
jgi:hypothetical protein